MERLLRFAKTLLVVTAFGAALALAAPETASAGHWRHGHGVWLPFPLPPPFFFPPFHRDDRYYRDHRYERYERHDHHRYDRHDRSERHRDRHERHERWHR